MNQEVGNINQKLNYLDQDRLQKDQVIANANQQIQNTNQQIQHLQVANAQLLAASSRGGGRPEIGRLVDLKTMAPKTFSGAVGNGSGDQYKTWAKKVKSFCNASKPGFKKFLKWCETQSDTIDPANMDLA